MKGAKNTGEILFRAVNDWKVVSEMLRVVPRRELEKMTSILDRVLENPYASGLLNVRDARNSGRKDRLKALTIHTRHECSAPHDVSYYYDVTLEKAWSSSGVEVGEANVCEQYISKDFHGFEYEHRYVKTNSKPVLRRGHGWAIVITKSKTDGDNYDWPEVDYYYDIVLV